MMVYAVMGVIEAVLKLGIAFYITYTGLDHLVMYGLLMVVLSVLLLIVKRIYCHRVYEECHLHIRQYFDKPLLKEMGGFAGWSLMGSSSSMIANYGCSIVINIFFGSILNAAQAIVNQVSAQLSVLGSTVLKVINPLIDKSMGSGNREYMLKVSLFSTKISFFLLAFTYLPFLVQIPLLLKLWLKVVPPYTIIFCILQLVRNLIEQLYFNKSS
jgi:O-antigen/teichoic acid export membrane protein